MKITSSSYVSLRIPVIKYRNRWSLICLTILMAGNIFASSPPPSHSMGDGNLDACSADLFDNGGSGSDYTSDQNLIETYCSDNGDCISITFNAFETESCCDYLHIYDGNSTSSSLIGTYQGTTSPGTITSSTGCLTLEFHSDYSVESPGWEATLACISCPGTDPCNPLTTSVSCGEKNIGSITNSGASTVSDPPCGNYQGGDQWFSVVVPSSGNLDITGITMNGGVPDLALAVYSTTNCSGSMTLITCDDQSGSNNMPAVQLTGQTPGATLYIRCWEPGNDASGSFELEISDSDLLFCLTDDATMFNASTDTCMQVTADVNSQRGCAWYKNTLDFSEDFDHSLEVYLGTNDGGADGMTFTFHSDPQGTTECGSDGQYLGAGGIENALIIEIDTWDNGGLQEIADDHIAIWTSNSGEGSPVAGPVAATSPASNIEDGAVHILRITWDATTQQLNVYFDGVLRLTVTDDFINNVFGTKNVFWGSTGSTGGASNQHYVCPPTSLISAPLPYDPGIIAEFQCLEPGISVLKWTTEVSRPDAVFNVEYSSDGKVFETIAQQVNAATSDPLVYAWDIDQDLMLSGMQTPYFRVLQTSKESGKESLFSNAVYAECTGDFPSINVFPNPIENELNIVLNKNYEIPIIYELKDVVGRDVLKNSIPTGVRSVRITLDESLAKGHYVFVLRTEEQILYRRTLSK